METVTAADLFKFLLRNNKSHQEQYLNDLENNYLPATVRNRFIIANDKDLFADDPDLDVEHIDRVYDRPLTDVQGLSNDELLKYDLDFMKGAADAQIKDTNTAEKIKDNIDKSQRYYDSKTVNDLSNNSKYSEDKSKRKSAWDNLRKLQLDRMLNNLYSKDLTDAEKVETALRLIYNNASRQLNTMPADFKLTQDDVYESLNPYVLAALQSVEPSFLERQRFKSDTVPMSYTSDKLFDDDGQEHSVFTPTEETNAIYDMFAQKFIKDLQEGKAPDPDELSAYIANLYSERLRTMTYADWQKLVDQMSDEINKEKELAKGEPLTEAEKVEIDVPDYALTPEDWASGMNPDKYKVGKTAAEKAENKLNRWHGKNKDEYKEYLEEMAATRNPDDYRSVIDKAEKEAAARLYIDYISKQLPVLCDKLESALNMGNDAEARDLSNKINWYNGVLHGTPEGIRDLSTFANYYVGNSHRKAHGLEDRKLTKEELDMKREVEKQTLAKTQATLEEAALNKDDPKLPAWAREAYNYAGNKYKKATGKKGSDWTESDVKSYLSSLGR